MSHQFTEDAIAYAGRKEVWLYPYGLFTNASGQPARLLCICAPAGQENFFLAVGTPVSTRTEPPPPLDEAAEAAFIAKSQALAPQYRTELLRP